MGRDSVSRVVPTTGMRGGLGRTLLTAFLSLTLIPLSLIGWYALIQSQRSLQAELTRKLEAIGETTAQHLNFWITERRVRLESLPWESVQEDRAFWASLHGHMPEVQGIVFFDGEGHRLTQAWGECAPLSANAVRGPVLDLSAVDPVLWLRSPASILAVCLQAQSLETLLSPNRNGAAYQVYLEQQGQLWPARAVGVASYPSLSEMSQTISHEQAMIMVYRFIPELGVGLLVQQARATLIEEQERMASTLIAFVLAVTLATTFIAAIVIRQITRPVIRLTEAALDIAEGNLDQHVTVTSRDEIGILTYVFNEMAADLKSLYDDLEAKVVERTRMLQQANYQIQRRAIQLQATQEVSQAMTSIRDPELLIKRVVELIRTNFAYMAVAIYIPEPGGGEIRCRAISPADAEWPAVARPGDGSLIERALRKNTTQMESHSTNESVEWYRRTFTRLAVPMRMSEQTLGVLAISSAEREGIQEDELQVLDLLANQLAVALDNARAYDRELLAKKQLEEAEAFKLRFLANMSHELREPLNQVLGFSRLMLKGLDGELTPAQREDLQRIYDNGQRLLALINDLLDISQLQAGLMELQFEPVDLAELIASVMPTAGALVRGKAIELVTDVADSIPPVRADHMRIRQTLVRLLTNAAKYTERGRITLRAWADDEQAYVSVSDTGIGIPPEDRERIFESFTKSTQVVGRRNTGAGLGLTLSKEFIALHGGHIWVESEEGKGSTFTFSLPFYKPEEEMPAA